MKKFLGLILLLFAVTLVGCELSDEKNPLDNPSEDYVVDCLEKVPNIMEIECVTEDNDPNGNLNKAGGYTACVYFSVDLIDQSEVDGTTVIDKGTDCGGCIEVYANEEDAVKRNDYLAYFDGGILASGSHKVVGTCVVRTSDLLTATQQKLLENNIIFALKEEYDFIEEINNGNNSNDDSNNSTERPQLLGTWKLFKLTMDGKEYTVQSAKKEFDIDFESYKMIFKEDKKMWEYNALSGLVIVYNYVENDKSIVCSNSYYKNNYEVNWDGAFIVQEVEDSKFYFTKESDAQLFESLKEFPAGAKGINAYIREYVFSKNMNYYQIKEVFGSQPSNTLADLQYFIDYAGITFDTNGELTSFYISDFNEYVGIYTAVDTSTYFGDEMQLIYESYVFLPDGTMCYDNSYLNHLDGMGTWEVVNGVIEFSYFTNTSTETGAAEIYSKGIIVNNTNYIQIL